MNHPLNVAANIAETRAENAARRAVDRRLQRARQVIMGARAIAVSIAGYDATEELLLDEAAATREEREHEDMVRHLKSGIRTSLR